MALYVNTNVTSLNSQRKLANATNSLNVSYQRLASGLRINSARDDAAGLQISDRLTAQINGLNQGNRNTNDGIALCQTVEGALDEVTNMLQRIRVLSVQSANGTYADGDRQALQEEVTQLSHEIFRISQKTTFAGAQVLDGKPADPPTQPNLVQQDGKVSFQVGANHDDTIDMDLGTSFKLSKMFQGDPTDGAYTSILHVPKSGEAFDYTDPKNGGAPKAWEDAITKFTQGNNPLVGLVVTGARLKTDTTPPKKLDASKTEDYPAQARWSISSAEMAQATLGSIDKILTFVDSKRAELGALQNRMESTVRNQSSIAENESDARSRIRDTDFAEETARMTSLNIIQNASQTILAQANQRPQIALQLLNAG